MAQAENKHSIGVTLFRERVRLFPRFIEIPRLVGFSRKAGLSSSSDGLVSGGASVAGRSDDPVLLPGVATAA
jgi:hypothetical protein